MRFVFAVCLLPAIIQAHQTKAQIFKSKVVTNNRQQFFVKVER